MVQPAGCVQVHERCHTLGPISRPIIDRVQWREAILLAQHPLLLSVHERLGQEHVRPCQVQLGFARRRHTRSLSWEGYSSPISSCQMSGWAVMYSARSLMQSGSPRSWTSTPCSRNHSSPPAKLTDSPTTTAPIRNWYTRP